jgi:hypothetical protein
VERRNPYIVLGISFGASREEANKAFARKAKALRRRGGHGHTALTDLTWALNQVDEAIRQPETELGIYRVPADPHAYDGVGVGVFNPPPERLPPHPGAEAALADLQAAAAHEYLTHLVSLRREQIGVPPP